jgi:hypothetical protein
MLCLARDRRMRLHRVLVLRSTKYYKVVRGSLILAVVHHILTHQMIHNL